MTSALIVKIGASASVVVAVCSAALIFGVVRVQNDEKAERGPVTATTAPSQPALPSQPELPSQPGLASQPELGVRSQASPAPAATEAKPAAVAAEPAAPSGAIATDQVAKDQSAPSFDVVRIEQADAVIAGRATPGAIVDLLRDSERLDRAVADASGEFVMVSPHLPAGSYELTLRAKLPDGTIASSKQGVKLTVTDTGASSRTAEARADYSPESASAARSQSQPPLQAVKPQANATLRPPQAPGNSASEDGATSAVAPRKSTKVVSRGDSLWRIGRITYGDGTQYAIVYRANRGRIRDPNLIYPGQVLVLPTKRH